MAPCPRLKPYTAVPVVNEGVISKKRKRALPSGSDNFSSSLSSRSLSPERSLASCTTSMASSISRGAWRSSTRELPMMRGGNRETGFFISAEAKILAEREKRIKRDLVMEFWLRTEECKEKKMAHLDYIDDHYSSREKFIEDTVFYDFASGETHDTVVERNMFPYDTPAGVEHWTLWSRNEMTEKEVEEWVTKWLAKHHPDVTSWNFDDNAGDRSILWFHVHVYIQRNGKLKDTPPQKLEDERYGTCSARSLVDNPSCFSSPRSRSRSCSAQPRKWRRKNDLYRGSLSPVHPSPVVEDPILAMGC